MFKHFVFPDQDVAAIWGEQVLVDRSWTRWTSFMFCIIINFYTCNVNRILFMTFEVVN